MDLIYNNDLKENNKYTFTLKQEVQSSSYLKTLCDSKKEIELGQYFLVASSFSERSLNYSGVPSDRIFKCTYGIDSSFFSVKIKNVYEKRRLNCIFIGKVSQKKGAFYLLDAIKDIDLEKFSFRFIGEYDEQSKYYNDFKDKCDFEGHVTKDKLLHFFSKADILIFPSLADGFGLSVLEALSCGIPTICSDNSGVSDLIEDGYNGFVVRTGNSKDIYEKLVWFDQNRDKLPSMSDNARKTAKSYSWDKYDDLIKTTIENICK
nr:glycosyltransferase [Neobacillus niacini]